MAKNLKEILVENSNGLVHMWLEEVAEKQKEVTNSAISQDLFENTNREFVNIIFGSVEKESLTSDLDNFTERVINLGWPLSYLTDGLQLFKRVAIEYLIEHEELDVPVPKVLRHVDELVNPIINQLVNEYSGSWENTVSLQRVALQELSAPLIPVMDNITVMPLIGTIDTERAKFIMENLLDGVIKHHAEVVLIDITGVPVVDTMVAHHIIQAAEAVRLIGSTCILVGIRPEIAQTIVNLGIDLSKFPTKSSLRKGFTTALEMTNQMIVQTNSEEQTIEELIDSLDRSEQS
ncbi:RsbR protein [Terribacillus saccharophilus]|uniref:RsbR protein n=1 Tax=Terribacillus saccharophilus TaxID=361277 RepID=A0A268HEC0_9BACI|nr:MULTISPECIES: RsbT co-antagonist protein RsbRA [Terribacillus]PAD34377.1 RsbR protein [Terribacillus saccharophilus]PAD95125.1 RsbR protein [Terribacillus saccharophilus]PAD98704.1 RsbR protein [Terribacillus saccharophilus]PAE08217.1 RsbR protein [Terribacillus saccharophilus]